MDNFENSKFKKVCYHGTSSEPFTVIDKSKIQKDPEDGDSGYFGWGFYLTTDKEYAEEYGDTVLAYKVNIQNPFDFSNVNSEEIVKFLFEDCKKLELRLKETLRVIYQIGREAVEFDVNNSKELLNNCKKLYNNYRDKEVTPQYIKDVKNILVQLSRDVGNWMNGLFFYFGRELFHYFTLNGYDGVIAQGGKEVVVYETEQLKQVTNEDLELDVADVPNWEEGADEYTNRIINSLKSNPDIHNIQLDFKLYPKRKEAIWYAGYGTFLSFIYKDILEVSFYCGGELEIYRSDDDMEGITSIEDLEEEGIFTDQDYYNFCDEYDVWGSGLADNNTAYFGFTFYPLKNNPSHEEIYHYDMGYDDVYDLDGYFSRVGEPLGWLFDEGIPEFIADNPEYFTDETAEEKPVQEDVEHKDIKRITKGQVLSDIINTFGYVSPDKITDAVYLLPNGKILDTKGSFDKSQHENVAKYISDKYNIKDMDENNGSKLMLELGSMRITPWIPAMFIPDILTEKQEHTLYDILMVLASKVSEDKPLMIASSDGRQQIEFTNIDNPEEVINSILGYQLFGVLKA